MKTSSVVYLLLAITLITAMCTATACAKKKAEEPKKTDAPTLVSDAPLDQSEWGNYFETVGNEQLAFAQSYASNSPTSLHLTWYSISGGRTRVYNDADTIIAAFNALAVLNVEGKSDIMTADDDSAYRFVLADGTSCSFSFNSGNAQIGRDIYRLSNDAAFKQFERRLRSEYDEGYGILDENTYDSLVEGQTWWGDFYELAGEPLTFEVDDEYTAMTVTYGAWDGRTITLDFARPQGGARNTYQLVSKTIQ